MKSIPSTNAFFRRIKLQIQAFFLRQLLSCNNNGLIFPLQTLREEQPLFGKEN